MREIWGGTNFQLQNTCHGYEICKVGNKVHKKMAVINREMIPRKCAKFKESRKMYKADITV